MSSRSPKAAVMTALRQLLAAARSGRYHVKRGYVDWVAHDYDAHPYPASIMCDVETLGGIGDTDTVVSVVLAARMPPEAVVDLDEDVLSDLAADARTAFEQLEKMRWAHDGQDEPLVFRLDWRGARLSEWHDVDLRLQGILLQVQVSY